MKSRARGSVVRGLWIAVGSLLLHTLAAGQALDERCIVSVNGVRTAVRPNGSFDLDNVPAGTNLVQVSAISVLPGITLYGSSEFVQVLGGETVNITDLVLSPLPPPSLLSITAAPDPSGPLVMLGEVRQVKTTGYFTDRTSSVVSLGSQGSSYVSSNPAIVSVNLNGLATANARGVAFIAVSNRGSTATTRLLVSPGDPMTTVEGFVSLEGGAPVANAMVSLPIQGGMALTDTDGSFCIGCVGSGVLSELGPITVLATADIAGETLVAQADIEPVPGGLTDAGILYLRDATPIQFGEVVSAAILSPSDVDSFVLAATDGDALWATVTASAALRFELIDPSGQVVDSRVVMTTRFEEQILDQGTWTLRISSPGATTGTYTIGLADLPVETLFPIVYDTFTTATISPYGDVDEHPFVGQAGQRVNVYGDAAEGNADLRVRLFRSNRTLAASGSFSVPVDDEDSSIVAFTLPADDTYLVLVHAESSTTTNAISYEVSIDAEGVNPIVLGHGQGTTGLPLTHGADIETIDFDATNMDLVWLTCVGAFPHRWELRRPNGTTLFIQEPSNPFSFRKEDFVFDQTGTHRLIIRDDAGRGTNILTAFVSFGISDHTLETLAPLSYNVVGPTDSINPFSDVDEWPLAALMGEIVTVYVDSTTTFDAQFRLLGPARNLLATGSVSTTSDVDDSEVRDFLIPADGSYIVQVLSEGIGGLVTSYIVSADRYGLDVHSLGYGASASDDVAFGGDLFEVEFDASAGDVAWLGIAGTGTSTELEYQVKYPDGSPLASGQTPARLTDEAGQLVLNQTGTYRVLLRSGVDMTGTVSVALSDQELESLPALVLNTPSSVTSISPFMDVDEWPFSGTAGQVVTVLADSSTTALSVRLLDSNRTVLATGVPFPTGSSVDARISSFMLPANGQYLIQVYARFVTSTQLPSYQVTVSG